MTAFTESYVALLIRQYYAQPRAVAEITAQAAGWEKIRDILVEFQSEFDLDTATGDRLDKIGKLVGLPRTLRAEFDLDDEYRFFLQLQIAVNNGSAFMVSDTRTSIQTVIQFAFDKLAYAIDNRDMTLTLFVDSTFDPARLQLVIALGLLPKPQGVRYVITTFNDNILNFGFSELGSSDPADAGTYSELGFPTPTDGALTEEFGVL